MALSAGGGLVREPDAQLAISGAAMVSPSRITQKSATKTDKPPRSLDIRG